MAAFDFPSLPGVGQLFTPAGGPTYVFDGTAWVVITPGVKNPSSAGFRNIFINGNFNIDQRQQVISGLVGGGWASDRWLVQSAGSSVTRAYAPFALGQTQVPGEPWLALQLAVASVAGASNYVYLVQKLEAVRSLASGQPYTLSFWAQANVARSIGFEIQRSFGTGGSPSPPDALICQKRFDLTTSWAFYSHTFTWPSIVGRVFGTAGDDCNWCIFWLDTGATNNPNSSGIGQASATILFANMQLEHGLVATPYEPRPRAAELALCQRYYEQGTSYECFPSNFAGGSASITIPFRVTKRAPSVNTFTYSGLGNRAGSTSYGAFVDACHLQVNSTTGGNFFQNVAWTATAEL